MFDVYCSQAMDIVKSKLNKRRIFQILHEVKLEQRLGKILQETDSDNSLLPITIECAFEQMTVKFKHDCLQHNPHMNYLKLSPILKPSMHLLHNKMCDILARFDANPDAVHSHRITTEVKQLFATLIVFLKCVLALQKECMVYVEAAFINKFFIEQFFRLFDFEQLVHVSSSCVKLIEYLCSIRSNTDFDGLTTACDCLALIIRINAIFNESNFFITDESHSFFEQLLNAMFTLVQQYLASEMFLEKNQLKTILSEQDQSEQLETTDNLYYSKAVFLGAFIENSFTQSDENGASDTSKTPSFRESVLALIIATLRSNSFYFFAVTPREVMNSFEWRPNETAKMITFHSVPIDCLNEIEIVEIFLKRYSF